MKKKKTAASLPQGYLLSEPLHQQLTLLHDQLRLMTDFVCAVTQEEDDELLQVRRSMLGRLLESYGLQINQVLSHLHRTKM